tara:strand:+ start:6231 stop:7016 length:786 start_codon:yes stop_codon:yes gene_type:complete
MKDFFVIGSKTSNSLSPLIFNYWFKKYNIKAKYTYIEVSPAGFDKALKKELENKKVYGLNVTIPFKNKIIKHLDISNVHAQNINAVNCVTVNKKIRGFNTDWSGYLNSIKNIKIKKSEKILILGYGGASKAIYYGFLLRGFKNIEVYNRSKKAIKFKKIKKYTKKYSLMDKDLTSARLIINTTPTNPIKKKQIKLIKNKTIISDIVYSPKETKFLQCFQKNKKIYGISMLLEQAVLCFYQWFGFSPKIDRNLIKKINNKIQ